MKKIPTLFLRREDDPSRVSNVLTPGCEWVLAGEGVATLKWDGTAVLVRGGVLYARFDAKPGRAIPPGFVPCQDEHDAKGRRPGWVPAEGPKSHLIREAAANHRGPLEDGTYELCGPRVGTRTGVNTHGFEHHVLVPHGAPDWPGARVGTFAMCDSFELAISLLRKREEFANSSLDIATWAFGALTRWFETARIEGIVWHHRSCDGRMAKVKRRDFGFPWPPPKEAA